MKQVNKEKVILADTLFEAHLRAEDMFGQGQYDILDSRVIHISKYLGLYTYDRYKLVVCQKQSEERDASMQNNVQQPKITYQQQSEIIPDYSLNEEESEYSVQPGNLTYSAGRPMPKMHQHSMREVDGLRSIQEGDSQPHSQKVEISEINFESNGSSEDLLQRLEKERLSRGHATRVEIERSIPLTNAINTEMFSKFNNLVEQIEHMQKCIETMNKNMVSTTEKKKSVLPEGLSSVEKNLLDVETPPEIANAIIKELAGFIPSDEQNSPLKAMKAYEDWCCSNVAFSSGIKPGSNKKGPEIIAFIGPTGVGKTTTIAKIAAAFKFKKPFAKKVSFFTLDTFRLGATEQLAHYAEIFDILLEVIYTPEELLQKIKEHSEDDVIIIDTAGRSQKQNSDLTMLSTFLTKIPSVKKYLVLAATSKYRDMMEVVNKFSKVGFDNLVFTKLDETNSVGPLLAVMLNSKTPLAYLTNGQNVPNDIVKADIDSFCSKILDNTLYC